MCDALGFALLSVVVLLLSKSFALERGTHAEVATADVQGKGGVAAVEGQEEIWNHTECLEAIQAIESGGEECQFEGLVSGLSGQDEIGDLLHTFCHKPLCERILQDIRHKCPRDNIQMQMQMGVDDGSAQFLVALGGFAGSVCLRYDSGKFCAETAREVMRDSDLVDACSDAPKMAMCPASCVEQVHLRLPERTHPCFVAAQDVIQLVEVIGDSVSPQDVTERHERARLYHAMFGHCAGLIDPSDQQFHYRHPCSQALSELATMDDKCGIGS